MSVLVEMRVAGWTYRGVSGLLNVDMEELAFQRLDGEFLQRE